MPSDRRPPKARHLDNSVARSASATGTIEFIPSRLRDTKQDIPRLTTRLEEVIRENGRLRLEVAHHEKVRDSLIQFYSKSMEAYRLLHQSIGELSERVFESEKELASYWGFRMNETQQEDMTLI